MAASTRGLVPRLPKLSAVSRLQPSRPHTFNRAFACLASLQATAKTVKAPPSQKQKGSASASRPIPVSPAAANNPLLLQLARSTSPTLLYESASHFWVKLTAWSTALFCYSGAAINFWLTSTAENVSWIVSPVYAFTSIALCGMGSFFLLHASNIVQTVRAIPTASLKTLPKSVSNPRLTPVLLEVAVKPLTPFARKPRVMVVPPEQVSLSRRIFTPPVTGEQERFERQREKAAKKAQWEADKQVLMTIPFRHTWRGAKAAGTGMKRALTGGGFVRMTVDNRKCKLDVASGWALDEGLALEGVASLEKQQAAQASTRRA